MYIKDSRAFFGASAMVMTGTILSVMVYQYFAGQYTEEAIGRSRSWWEIAMNIQVLALACIWFCYADAIRSPNNAKSKSMRVSLVFGLVAVSVPFFITILSVWNGWFEVLPPVSVVENIILAMLVFYFFATLTPKLFRIKYEKQRLTMEAFLASLKPKSMWYMAPSQILLAVVVYDVIAATNYTYIWIPFLLYFQAGLPYCSKGLAKGVQPVQAKV